MGRGKEYLAPSMRELSNGVRLREYLAPSMRELSNGVRLRELCTDMITSLKATQESLEKT